MKEFASVRVEDAEAGVHKVLVKHGFSVDVPIEYLDVGPGKLKKFPFIGPMAWAQFLLDSGRIAKQLCGVANFVEMELRLCEFWHRYEVLYPTHQLFSLARQGTLSLSRTIPVFTHADEGRSYKHLPLMVVSFHGATGRGTRSFIQKGMHKLRGDAAEFGLNFIGCTWSTQFMVATMLREVFDAHPDAFQAILRRCAEDFAALARVGIRDKDGNHLWLIHLNNKGDLPALTKLSGAKRSFSHVPRAAQSRTAATGICHVCLAGVEASRAHPQSLPYEDVSLHPSWEGTIDTVPWSSRPALLEGLPVCPGKEPSFFQTDIWHNIHLGIAKHWIAGGFVCLVERFGAIPTIGGNGVEAKFTWMTRDFGSFCKTRRISPHSKEISRASLNWPSSRICPIGAWSKGSMSTHLLLYLEDLCTRFVVGKTDDEVLLAVVPWLTVHFFCKLVLCWLGTSSYLAKFA